MQDFINDIDESKMKQVMSDAKIQSISTKENQILFSSKLSSLYLYDIQEDMTIKLQGSHYQSINLLKTDESILVSIGSDFTCKVFES